jgi:hypothetical protein
MITTIITNLDYEVCTCQKTKRKYKQHKKESINNKNNVKYDSRPMKKYVIWHTGTTSLYDKSKSQYHV